MLTILLIILLVLLLTGGGYGIRRRGRRATSSGTTAVQAGPGVHTPGQTRRANRATTGPAAAPLRPPHTAQTG